MARVNLITKEKADQIAKNYLENNEKIKAVYVTRDGQVFLENSTGFRVLHERTNRLEPSWLYKKEVLETKIEIEEGDHKPPGDPIPPKGKSGEVITENSEENETNLEHKPPGDPIPPKGKSEEKGDGEIDILKAPKAKLVELATELTDDGIIENKNDWDKLKVDELRDYLKEYVKTD